MKAIDGIPGAAAPWIPHDSTMRLIDVILEVEPARIRSELTVREHNPFHVAGRGLPGYVGFELMAQTISAHDSLMRAHSGEPPVIGLLLGCRRYRCARDWLPAGEVYVIEATAVIAEGEMRCFDCVLEDSQGDVVASGTINVFRPDDPSTLQTRNEP
ncbi:MAG: 3-hydroxyacyl-ACP dehydratase [Gammaproteobacteria bacterium]|nr:MAG: 3-hydroxyacyl-ACP dehydratase [Gammaproteobacteria bacterium]